MLFLLLLGGVALVWALIQLGAANARLEALRATALHAHDEMKAASVAAIGEAFAAGRAAAEAERALPTAPTPARAIPKRDVLPISVEMRSAGYWRTPPIETCPFELIATSLAGRSSAAVQICFTGWLDFEKAALQSEAASAGWRVRANVSKYLTLLCVGANPGPLKVETAREQRVALISGATFDRLIREGWD